MKNTCVSLIPQSQFLDFAIKMGESSHVSAVWIPIIFWMLVSKPRTTHPLQLVDKLEIGNATWGPPTVRQLGAASFTVWVCQFNMILAKQTLHSYLLAVSLLILLISQTYFMQHNHWPTWIQYSKKSLLVPFLKHCLWQTVQFSCQNQPVLQILCIDWMPEVPLDM